MTKIINIIRTILDKNKHCGESIGDEKVMDADSTVEGIAYNSTTSERANSWNNVLLVTESTQDEEANKKKLLSFRMITKIQISRIISIAMLASSSTLSQM